MATYTELKTKAGTAGTEHKKKLRRAVSTGVLGTVGALAFLLITAWTYSWVYGPASAPAVVHRAPAVVTTTLYDVKCGDHAIRQDVSVTAEPLLINPNPHHCNLRWLVKSGTIQMLGSLVPFGRQNNANSPGDTRDAIISEVVAVNGRALIDYQLCPATHRAPGWC